jgi:hypothetical protein
MVGTLPVHWHGGVRRWSLQRKGVRRWSVQRKGVPLRPGQRKGVRRWSVQRKGVPLRPGQRKGVPRREWAVAAGSAPPPGAGPADPPVSNEA